MLSDMATGTSVPPTLTGNGARTVQVPLCAPMPPRSIPARPTCPADGEVGQLPVTRRVCQCPSSRMSAAGGQVPRPFSVRPRCCRRVCVCGATRGADGRGGLRRLELRVSVHRRHRRRWREVGTGVAARHLGPNGGGGVFLFLYFYCFTQHIILLLF